MERYFNINYEFDKQMMRQRIDEQLQKALSDYICVVDGVVLSETNRDAAYREVVNGGMFAICDSSWVPLFIRWIHGVKREQYCGSQIFRDIVSSGRYRMYFMGADSVVLDALKQHLSAMNAAVNGMRFVELPFAGVDDFDYPSIAHDIEDDGADIVWVALGAPKQELFMSRLKPFLHHGVMIAVGAAFKFFSGVGEKRAPQWMVRHHLEFLYRLVQDPKKQMRRCARIVKEVPGMVRKERNA
jgi:N-acetylglucosaminyldiphosphoundecaprenol N-acetyl-beta-D-mannosaminyltransferase